MRDVRLMMSRWLAKVFGLRFGIIVLVGVGAMPSVTLASPWVEADDPLLRASIQQLADAGFLRGTTITYPLMWSGISRDLRNIDVAWLTPDERFAYYRVRSAQQFAQQRAIRGVRASVDSDEQRVGGFAGSDSANGALEFSRSFTGAHTAGRVRTTLRANSFDDNSVVLDGSFLATIVGNWVVSVDQMPVWWGPANDNALALSTNARPVQALRINRLDDHSLRVPVLDWLGHWDMTAFIGRTGSDGLWSDHFVGGARFTTRPINSLQLGLSYTQRWGNAERRDDRAPAYDISGERNQLAALDARLALPNAFAVYSEVAKRVGPSALDDGLAFTLGVDHYLGFSQHLHQLFLELTDVPALFYADSTYADSTDMQGYQRWQQSMGTALGQDTTAISFGYKYQRPEGTAWMMTLRSYDLGAQNARVYRHSDQHVDGIQGYQLQLDYQRAVGDVLFRVGTTVTRDKLESVAGTNHDSDISLRMALEYRF